jgi:hypothetical protein
MARDGIGPERMSFSHGRTTPMIVETCKRRAVPTACPRGTKMNLARTGSTLAAASEVLASCPKCNGNPAD